MHHQSRCCETSREDVLATIRQYLRPLHALAQAAQPGDPDLYGYLDDIGRWSTDAYHALGEFGSRAEFGVRVERAILDVRSGLAAVATLVTVILEPVSWPWPDTPVPQRELVEAAKRIAAALWQQYRDVDAVLAEWSAGRVS